MADFDKWIEDAKPTMSARQVARLALEQRLAAVVHYLPLAAFLAGESVEYVHAARVSARRAVAALKLFAPFTPKSRSVELIGMLKDIRESMGEARDLDIYLAKQNIAGSESYDEIARRLRKQRRRTQVSIVATAIPLLKKERLSRRVQKLLEKTRDDEGETTFTTWARKATTHEWKRLCVAAPLDNPGVEELHRFRIATKRFRYSLELLSGGLPKEVRDDFYPEITLLQSKLGKIQDHAVAVRKLGEWREKAKREAERRHFSTMERHELKQLTGKTREFCMWWKSERMNDWEKLLVRAFDAAP